MPTLLVIFRLLNKDYFTARGSDGSIVFSIVKNQLTR